MDLKTLGRYKILGELGRGAMGAVYRAVDPLIDREVAIKTLLPNLPPEVMDEVRERFLREARSAGRLNHPSIVTIFDVGEHEGMAYIAMELINGHSLQDILRHPQRLAFGTIANIAAQIAEALDHAQQMSIVHRDVKPANVMVDASARAKLTDFGVAYVPSSTMTQAGTALGSPRYMSPEQVLGRPIDPRSDIFSLGVVLYEMLARRTPFEEPQDSTVFPLMTRIAGAPHPRLRTLDPRIPEAFEPIVDRALAKDPAQRYARAGDMARDLRAIRSPSPTTTTGSTAAAPTAAAPRPAAPIDDAVRTQLIQDLDRFAEQFEREEQERIRQAEAERLRKEEEVRRWAEAQARERAAFERAQEQSATAATATGKARALDLVRQQATAQPAADPPGLVRARRIVVLDKAMREAAKYLAELVRQLNEAHPAAARPYEFLYLGKLPKVWLSEAFVDSRPVRIDGKDMLEHLMFRFRITPAQPARATVLGEDIARCEQYLKYMRVAFEQQVLAKNDFGKPTRAEVVVSASLPCEVNVRADYAGQGSGSSAAASDVAIELTNVRRLGRVACKVPPAKLEQAVDDLARYLLGADDDFEGWGRA